MLLVMACIVPQSIAAQEVSLDEITVSPNKRTQTLGSVDGAVSVQTEADLKAAEVKNVSDLEKVFPGLVIRQRGNRAYSNFTVRGMSSPDFYNPTVQVYVDGVPQADSFLTQELVNVARVEFLRGPQGTLYGKNAYGGVLNIITRKPRENSISAGATATNQTQYGHLYATGNYRDVLFTDIAVNGFGDRGQITDPTSGDEVDTAHNWSGKVRWRYAPAGGPFDATFYVSKERLKSREEIYVADSQIDQRLYPVGVPYPLLQRDAMSTALSWNYAFGPFKLTSITSYQDVDLDRQLFGSRSPETTTLWSQEARLTYDNGGPLTGIAGVYLQDTAFTRRQLTGAYRVNDVDTRSYAVFGEFTYAILPRLFLTAGARGSIDESSIDYRGAFSINNSASFNGVQPKLSLGYQITDHARIYALVSRGYKAGGFNHAVSTAADANPYQPETAWNYEVGGRSTFWDGRLTLSGALYYIDSRDKQIYVGVVPNQVIRNVGEATSKGIELESTLRATDLLTLNASVTYGTSKFDDYIDPFTMQDFSGNQIPYAPNATVHAGFRQILPQNWWTELALTGAVHYFSRTYFNESNTLSQPAYATFDLGLEAQLRKGLFFKVFGTNLSNEIYRTYTFGTAPFLFSNIGQGRLVGVSFYGTY
jgi:pesticin/yersiniabactin receptor